MKAGSLPALLLLSTCLVSGCFNAHLYPVQGPLASQTPPPIYAAKVVGAFNSGKVSATLANGEVFAGPWKAISVKERAAQSAAGKQPAFSLSAAWDTVYGPGFYTAHVLGTRLFAQATLTGSHGTALQMEMYRHEHPGDAAAPAIDVKGVAKDDQGNIYKLAF
jgi:hypothetical protein